MYGQHAVFLVRQRGCKDIHRYLLVLTKEKSGKRNPKLKKPFTYQAREKGVSKKEKMDEGSWDGGRGDFLRMSF